MKVPYVGMIHDSQLLAEVHRVPRDPHGDQRRADEGRPGAFRLGLPACHVVAGVLERGGDGKDVSSFKGPSASPARMMEHFRARQQGTSSTWTWRWSTLPFLPNLRRKPFDTPRVGIRNAASLVRRSLGQKLPAIPTWSSSTAERRSTTPERPVSDDSLWARRLHADERSTRPLNPKSRATCPFRPTKNVCARSNHRRATSAFFIGDDFQFTGMLFYVPRSKDAPEGDGYLVGVRYRLLKWAAPISSSSIRNTWKTARLPR